MGIIFKAAIFYVAMIAAAVIVVWLGPGFSETNGQLVFLFCLVAGIPAAITAAKT